MTSKTTNDKPVYLSPEGLEKAKKELHELIHVKRQEVSEQIAEAKSFGNLSENAEYEHAKELQAFIEGRITELHLMIKNAQLIDPNQPHEKVTLGSKVSVEIDQEKVNYTIVGSAEANPLEGKISNESPIGSALMGKKKGDIIKAKTPRGDISIKILTIV